MTGINDLMFRALLTITSILISLCLSAQSDTLFADLDVDGVKEMLVQEPYDAGGRETDTLMVIKAYRKKNQFWEEWSALVGPVLYAMEEVGFETIWMSFERGALVIRHGRSGFNYIDYTHRFRWQNNRFELIGATVSWGERFRVNKTIDFNLSTGNYRYEKAIYSDDKVVGKPTIVEGVKILGRPLLLESFEIGNQHVKLRNGEVVAF